MCLHFLFLSTPSVWRATDPARAGTRSCPYFYPRPPCGGRLHGADICLGNTQNFYPRPPCGGRQRTARSPAQTADFYPRPPCGGRLGFDCAQGRVLYVFLSTPSVWRATLGGPALHPAYLYFYPRPPCGGRPLASSVPANLSSISIHALRVEGDAGQPKKQNAANGFLSTPSVWRATLDWLKQSTENVFLSTPSVWRATRCRSGIYR